jgi:hypothetical protein
LASVCSLSLLAYSIDPGLEIIFLKSIMENTRKGYVFARVGDEDICHGVFLIQSHVGILRNWRRTNEINHFRAIQKPTESPQ